MEELMRQDLVSVEDILAALTSTRPSSDGKMTKYVEWQNDFGAV